VSADDEVNGITLQDAARNHGLRAAYGFFGGLKKECELTFEIVAPSRKKIGHTKEAGHVNVVTARVHDAVVQ
jgi:hypothetical protein